jgi:hypothetical protein
MLERPVEDGLAFGKRVAKLATEERSCELDARLTMLEELYPDAAAFLGLATSKRVGPSYGASTL